MHEEQLRVGDFNNQFIPQVPTHATVEATSSVQQSQLGIEETILQYHNPHHNIHAFQRQQQQQQQLSQINHQIANPAYLQNCIDADAYMKQTYMNTIAATAAFPNPAIPNPLLINSHQMLPQPSPVINDPLSSFSAAVPLPASHPIYRMQPDHLYRQIVSSRANSIPSFNVGFYQQPPVAPK